MKLAANEKARKRVVVIGGGFAGLHATIALSKAPVDVTLVDRRNHHTFQPLLYQVALAVLSPANIAEPLRVITRNMPNVSVLMDEVVGIDTAAHVISLKSGAELEYDYLILASGSTHSYFGHDEWEQFAPGLKTVEDALEIRRRVLLAFELAERETLETGVHPQLNFVIIGGGPTGVELAGAISDIAKLYMKKDFRHIDPASARVIILEGAPDVLMPYPPDLRQKALEQLQGLGVEVRSNTRVTGIGPGYVMIGDQKMEAAVTLWAAGVQASPLAKMAGFQTDKRGSAVVNATLNPSSANGAVLQDVFVCGDLAHAEQNGKQVPGVAQPAMQMGDHAAKMISEDLAGSQRTPFHYFDKGDMATIGRKAAVADVKWPFTGHLGGLSAWFTWLVVHIFFLIGFRNRISVLSEWIWTYFFFTDGARLITGSQNLPGWETETGAEGASRKAASDTGRLDAASPK